MKRSIYAFLLSASVLLSLCTRFTACQSPQSPTETAQTSPAVTDSLLVDYVWAGHPVGFDLLTDPPYQYVAYYDSARVMTVARRRLDEQQWDKVQLDEVTGWDSHNYIALALDSEGYLHVSGNMHVDTLVYYQAGQPYDIYSLQRRDSLVGRDEIRVTYPKFFDAPGGDLIFTYRIGGSGNGNQIYNRYNPETQTWGRLLDEPLVDGEGKMNAYLHGPVQGPDGFFHLVWVWRDTPDAETNHDLSYAKSRDLVHWMQSDGTPQALPITLGNAEIIDPVPPGQGMINGNTIIGFDQADRPVVSYHKFDEDGHTQIYQARQEADGWQIYQSTDYDFRWDFRGRGSLGARIRIQPLQLVDQQLQQQVWLDTAGFQTHILDTASLRVVRKYDTEDNYPLRLDQAQRAGHEVNRASSRAGDTLYLLRWETLPRNRDRPRDKPWPEPVPLYLYEVE